MYNETYHVILSKSSVALVKEGEIEGSHCLYQRSFDYIRSFFTHYAQDDDPYLIINYES